MATYAAVQGVMAAIEGMLNERMPPELKAAPVNGSVSVFGSQTFKQASSNTLALWLYRISIDPAVPRRLRARPPRQRGRTRSRGAAVPYVARGIHVELLPDMQQYAAVVDRTNSFGPVS